MKYLCGGIYFDTLEIAVEYANHMYENRGYVLSIEKVVMLEMAVYEG